MAYAHKNSRDQTYYLHGKDVTLKNGHTQRIYYFARKEKKREAMPSLPPGYKVGESPRTGLPFLARA